ncbi:hypothetical protein LFL96_21095 [Paraburkholderia sp. D15]|uniref:hypothetical protein n=1 Tax=Paraburkholderia sp. D15 TaxID=2880218 RepID=UPI0024790358|nr:hypothetical protein [Paraburkholderia sp. D15]WGS53558.1 hypothetical protein LFL96_21095 [Paraburkholderia sp. D15]
MLNWLKWKIAGRELAELERWRFECAQARRWLVGFPETSVALDWLSKVAEGKPAGRLEHVRSKMDCLRATDITRSAASPIWAPLRMKAVATQQPVLEPTFYDVGIATERGIEYRFLGVTGEEDA